MQTELPPIPLQRHKFKQMQLQQTKLMQEQLQQNSYKSQTIALVVLVFLWTIIVETQELTYETPVLYELELDTWHKIPPKNKS